MAVEGEPARAYARPHVSGKLAREPSRCTATQGPRPSPCEGPPAHRTQLRKPQWSKAPSALCHSASCMALGPSIRSALQSPARACNKTSRRLRRPLLSPARKTSRPEPCKVLRPGACGGQARTLFRSTARWCAVVGMNIWPFGRVLDTTRQYSKVKGSWDGPETKTSRTTQAGDKAMQQSGPSRRSWRQATSGARPKSSCSNATCRLSAARLSNHTFQVTTRNSDEERAARAAAAACAMPTGRAKVV